MPQLSWLNHLAENEAIEALLSCCGSRRWAYAMARSRPFSSERDLFEKAQTIWQKLFKPDWLEAFSHHPRIGDIQSLRQRFASTAQWSTQEQSGVQGASENTLKALAEGNAEYEKKFGYVFLICATGKSAEQMLRCLRERLPHSPEKELQVACAEQAKIIRIRLEKLLIS